MGWSAHTFSYPCLEYLVFLGLPSFFNCDFKSLNFVLTLSRYLRTWVTLLRASVIPSLTMYVLKGDRILVIQFADVFLPVTHILYHGGSHYHWNSARQGFLLSGRCYCRVGPFTVVFSFRFSFNSVCQHTLCRGCLVIGWPRVTSF